MGNWGFFTWEEKRPEPEANHLPTPDVENILSYTTYLPHIFVA
jgi:hypothetical protein